MLNSLVSKSLESKDLTWLEKFPQILLQPKEIEMINWLTEYQDKHGDIPTKDRFDKSEFSGYLTDYMVSSPLSDLYDLSVNAKKEQFAQKHIRDIQIEIDENPDIVPTQKIIDLGFLLSSLSGDTTVYLSDYDRDSLYDGDNPPKRVKFGFDIIDDNTGGLQAGEFGIIVARPETGKTWLTNFISWNVVTGYNYQEKCGKVLYVSAEMTPEKIISRMDGIAGGFNTKLLRTKLDKDALKEAKRKAIEAWNKVKFMGGEFIIPKIGLISPQNVLDLINTHKPDLVVCDAMYRFVNPRASADNWRSDAEIVRQIANISRITNTPILGTTQFKRDSDKGAYDLNDISFTDAYGQEASIVLSAYTMPSHSSSIILQTLKARDGSKFGNVEIKISFNNSSYTEKKFENFEDK